MSHNITKDDIIKHVNESFAQPTTNSLLKFKKANMWIDEAKLRPLPNQLFDAFWHENELCILFSDSNVGKSILAVQITESIASGNPIPGFKIETSPQKVLYFDFELSDKQFQLRYNNPNNPNDNYRFHDNFVRVEINTDAEIDKDTDLEKLLIAEIENKIIEEDIKTLIIDNLTYLKSDNEKAKDALPFIKSLQQLKKKYNLSLLILAHTPKRDTSKPIKQNDLSGSKMLMNFINSSFTIGMSEMDGTLRYIKQIKQRNGSQCYGADNVCICKVEKLSNFLGFNFIEYGMEYLHLKEKTKKDKTELVEQVKQLKAEGKNQREIAKQLEIGLGSVNNYLKK